MADPLAGRQRICKPGSVHPFSGIGDHSSRRTVAGTLQRPTRATGGNTPICRPYSVLLPVGFTLPPLSPAARCALTAPFQPYPDGPGGFLSVALSLGSPPAGVTRHRRSVEPGLSSNTRVHAAARSSGGRTTRHERPAAEVNSEESDGATRRRTDWPASATAMLSRCGLSRRLAVWEAATRGGSSAARRRSRRPSARGGSGAGRP